MPPKKNIITLLKDRETNNIPLTNNNDAFARLEHLGEMNAVREHKQRFQQTLNRIGPPKIDRRNVGGRKTLGRGGGRGGGRG